MEFLKGLRYHCSNYPAMPTPEEYAHARDLPDLHVAVRTALEAEKEEFLRESTRRHRKALVFFSSITLFVAVTRAFPRELPAAGVSFDSGDLRALRYSLLGILIYFLMMWLVNGVFADRDKTARLFQEALFQARVEFKSRHEVLRQAVCDMNNWLEEHSEPPSEVSEAAIGNLFQSVPEFIRNAVGGPGPIASNHERKASWGRLVQNARTQKEDIENIRQEAVKLERQMADARLSRFGHIYRGRLIAEFWLPTIYGLLATLVYIWFLLAQEAPETIQLPPLTE